MSSSSRTRPRARLAPALLAALTIVLAGAAAASARPAHTRAASATAVCRVPHILGLERFFAEVELFHGVGPGCPHLKLGRVTVRHARRRGPLIVVAQTPRANAPAGDRRSVAVTLAPAPPLPRACRAPALYQLLADTHQLIVWRVTRAGTGEHEPEEASQSYYACVPPDGHKRKLIETGENGTELVSAGTFVAFTESRGNRYGGGQALQLEDVRDGHQLGLGVIAYGPVSNEPPPAALVACSGNRSASAPKTWPSTPAATSRGSARAEGSAAHRWPLVLYVRVQDRVSKLAVAARINSITSAEPISGGAPEGRPRARRSPSPRRRPEFPGVGSAHRRARRCDIHLRCSALRRLAGPARAGGRVRRARPWLDGRARAAPLTRSPSVSPRPGTPRSCSTTTTSARARGSRAACSTSTASSRTWRAAVAYARGLERIEPTRIALWGSSFSGGHVIETAARDDRVAAVIAQVAFIDGFANLLRLGRRRTSS